MDTNGGNPDLTGLVLLAPDNFATVAQTPWAGTRIAETYKARWAQSAGIMQIGESWDFSCDPRMPSRLSTGMETLIDLCQKNPDDVFSPSLRRSQEHSSCEILVKLLNAAVPLSFQVHPADGDRSLGSEECGKPESWLVLASEPGSGIYLGFSRPISVSELRQCIAANEDITTLLNFVPTQPGDYFEISPGVPHAIGGGQVILEPQRIFPGKSGKTLRLWDWGRRYNDLGEVVSEGGQPRALHLDAALDLIDPIAQVGPKFSDSCRRSPVTRILSAQASLYEYPDNGFYRLYRVALSPASTCKISIDLGYGAILCLEGNAVVEAKSGKKTNLIAGQPALLPWAARQVSLTATTSSDTVIVVPSRAVIQFSS